ncbi:MAG: branched-chain amino acid ABC transporter permease [Actinomycetota bacterium]
MTTTTGAPSRNADLSRWLRHNRARLSIVAFLAFVPLFALFGTDMTTNDLMVAIIRGLAVGAITFLVVSGLSLILGLMDVLSLMHGELYMLGAYVGWTIYVRPDTFLDMMTPVALALSGMALLPLWRRIASQWPAGKWPRRIVPAVALIVGLLLMVFLFGKFPLSIWNPDVVVDSPGFHSTILQSGTQVAPEPAGFDGISPIVGLLGMWIAGAIFGFGIAAAVERNAEVPAPTPTRGSFLVAGGVALFGLIVFALNTPLTEWWYGMGTTPRFFLSLVIAPLLAFALGAFLEVVFVRPLYERLLFQLMMTLGLGFIMIELSRSIWGDTGFTSPRPAALDGTIEVFGSKIRMYQEVFIIAVGIIVLGSITLLLRKSRLGMTIRAGVQDSDMVEALGINVRRVFTITFALGVSLAALGGVIAGPALSLNAHMGGAVLLTAIVAMAIGGLTSFPGAAVGAVIVGILQQIMVQLGSVGIPIPGLAEPLKPSPAIVPASSILVMIIVLMVLPNGLMGRED